MATNRELAQEYLNRFPTNGDMLTRHWVEETDIDALEALLDIVGDSDGIPTTVTNTPTVPMRETHCNAYMECDFHARGNDWDAPCSND